MTNGRLPLERFSVLDLTGFRAGPTAVRQLADWGAHVLKIDAPGVDGDATGGSRDGPDFQNLHRNKEAMTLNLKSPEGHEIFMKLAAKADVIVENYRSDVKFRLGVDYESVRKINSRIIYGSISGFGQDGPYATRPGVDQIAQGMGGLMSITGEADGGPLRVGIPIADLTSGIFLAQGILLALLDREFTGEGQWVQTSLLESQIFMLDFQATRWLMNGEIPRRAGNDHPTGSPTGSYATADGSINISASDSVMWPRFCRSIGLPELIDDPMYVTLEQRLKNRKALSERIGSLFRQTPTAHWLQVMNEAGVTCGPIYTIDQTFADPQVRHLGIAKPVDHPRLGEIHLVGQPIRLSNSPQPARLRPTADTGQHTAAVMEKLGYSAAQIADLRARKIL